MNLSQSSARSAAAHPQFSVSPSNVSRQAMRFVKGIAGAVVPMVALGLGVLPLATPSRAATLPAAPSSLTAKAATNSVVLTWQDNATNELGFKVERRTGATGAWVELARIVQANLTRYEDTNLKPGLYGFRVRAFATGINGDYSPTQEVTLGAPTPAPTATAKPTATAIPVPPASGVVAGNDTFANASALSGTSGKFGGDSSKMTGEANEPDDRGEGTNSQWWKWTAPANGRVRTLMLDTTCLAALRAFTGSRVDSLNIAADFAQISNFVVYAGTTYYFQFGGAYGTRGKTTFSWNFTPGAVPAPTATPTPKPTPTPVSGLPGVIGNDMFSQAAVISGTSGTISADTNGKSGETGEPSVYGEGTNSVWWCFTPSTSGKFSLSLVNNNALIGIRPFVGKATNALTVAANFGEVVNMHAGQTYYIQMGGAFGARGWAIYNWKFVSGAVPNPTATPLPRPTPTPAKLPGVIGHDMFSQATIISGGSGIIAGDTNGKTGEDGEPEGGYGESSNSVWWRFTAPSNGKFTVSLADNNALVAIRAFSGSSVGALTPIGSYGGPFTMVASKTYYIQMGGAYGARGWAIYNWKFTPTTTASTSGLSPDVGRKTRLLALSPHRPNRFPGERRYSLRRYRSSERVVRRFTA